MAGAYEELPQFLPKDLGQGNEVLDAKDYFTVPVVNLFPGTKYSFNFQWVYPDGKVSQWSDGYSLTTSTYTTKLTKPTIDVTAAALGYIVSYTKQTDSNFGYIAIEESISSSPTAPTTGWSEVVVSSSNPIQVTTGVSDLNNRWVRARLYDKISGITAYSDPQSVKPFDPVADSVDFTPPPNVVSVATEWVGGSLQLTPTFATGDDSVRFLINLTGVLNSVSATRTFFVWRSDLVGGKVTISALDIYNRFGSCAYTSFTGNWKSADKADNINTGTAFSTSTRTSSLSGITPTISASDITALADGLSIKFTLPAGATHAKVYKRATSWGNPSGQPTITPTSAEIGGSGVTPVYVADTTYSTIYVRLAFSNDCGDLSLYSNELTASAINPVTVDINPPPVATLAVATPTLSGSKYQAIATITQTAGTDTKEYRLRYKPSTSSTYITELVKYVSTSTTNTIFDLIPSTTYNISVASVDAANNTSAYSTDVNFTTGALSVDPPATATLTASTAGAVASWTAPSVIRAPISRYKVELYKTGTPTLISTEYSFSTNMSFGGLSAGSYYVNVYAEDIYGTSHVTPRTSSTISVTGVGTSDGLVPLSSPAAVVSPLYGALEVKWTGLTLGARSTTANPDPVTYEVHVSTTNNFTPSSSTLALQVDGTFAILKTLPPTPTPPTSPTPLTYGTTYYVKLLAKDADGPAASYGTQGSGVPSAIDNEDIKADAVRANVIQAGTITADQINSLALLANKTITVGARSAIVTSATVSGGNIVYTTSGTHGFGNATLVTVTGITTAAFNIVNYTIQSLTTNTFTVLVGTSGATGSISSQSGVATSTVNTAIKIDASGTGLAANPFKFYSGAGVYNDSGTSPGTPFYLDSIGQFSLRDKLTFNPITSTLSVNGAITAQSGSIAGIMTIGGTMNLGINSGGNGNSGIYISPTNYWYTSGNFSVGATNNTVAWNGTTLNVTGAINARSGAFQGNVNIASGSSLYSGTLTGNTVTSTGDIGGSLSGAGYILNSTGLTFSNGLSGNSLRQTTIVGATGLFITNSANIGGWVVDSSKLQRGTGATGNLYAGISSTGTYTFWAGSTTDGGADVAPFWVKPDGSVKASNISLVGSGTASDFINAGTGVFKVTQDGSLTATSAEITGKIKATSGEITGSFGVLTGGTLYMGALTQANRVILTPSGITGYKYTAAVGATPAIDSAIFTLNTSGSGTIGGWNFDGSSLSSSGMILRSSDQTITFKNGFIMDNDVITVPNISATTIAGSTGDEIDTPESEYSSFGAATNSVLGSTFAIKLATANAQNSPRIAMTNSSTNGASVLLNNVGNGYTSSIQLANGGVDISLGRIGAVTLRGFTNKYHYAKDGVTVVSAMLMIKPDGTVSSGRAIFKSTSAETAIIPGGTTVSSHAYVGLIGDLMFSTAD